MARIYKCSLERLEKLREVLDRMIEAKEIWTKVRVCKEIGVDPIYLSPSTTHKRWSSAQKAQQWYEEACLVVRTANFDAKKYRAKIGHTRYLEDELKDLAAYNKKLRQFCSQLKAENDRLRTELERVNGERSDVA